MLANVMARLGSVALWSRKFELGCYFSVPSGGARCAQQLV